MKKEIKRINEMTKTYSNGFPIKTHYAVGSEEKSHSNNDNYNYSYERPRVWFGMCAEKSTCEL